jgi:TIR domain
VFVSYARKDGYAFASKLYGDLEEAGETAWMDKNYLQPGVSWAREIEKAIDECSFLIAVLTQTYIFSEICRAEHMRALRKGKVVIPVQVKPLPHSSHS